MSEKSSSKIEKSIVFTNIVAINNNINTQIKI